MGTPQWSPVACLRDSTEPASILDNTGLVPLPGGGLYARPDGPYEDLCTEQRAVQHGDVSACWGWTEGTLSPCNQLSRDAEWDWVEGSRQGSAWGVSLPTTPRARRPREAGRHFPPKGSGDRGPSGALLPFARTTSPCFRSRLQEGSPRWNHILGPSRTRQR